MLISFSLLFPTGGLQQCVLVAPGMSRSSLQMWELTWGHTNRQMESDGQMDRCRH